MTHPNDMKESIRQMTIGPDATIREAMRAVVSSRLRLGALLCDPATGRLLGVVTDGDMRRALLSGKTLDSPIVAISTPDPVTAPAGTPVGDLVRLTGRRNDFVPLLDEDGRVVDLAIFDQRVRLPVAEPFLGESELRYVSECVLSGWVSSGGKFVQQFEEMFAELCGARHGVAVCNGTAALHLALVAMGIGQGDEVIVPSFTFIATANAVTYTGARPVFVDCDERTWTIDPAAVAAAVTPRTRAVIPVHIYGHPADMDAIAAVADRHGLVVLEDAAQAHGAQYKGRRVGGLGVAGCFSFYGNKIVTTGEGGMVVTNDAALCERMRMLRDHGMSPDRRYWHPVVGYNYRMTNLQAALGVAQMEKIERILDIKRHIAQCYDKGLIGIPGITRQPRADWAESVCWLYSVLVDPQFFGANRDALAEVLAVTGIETRPILPPVHRQPVYENGQTLPITDRIGLTGLSLPSSVGISDRDIDRVVEAIVGFRARSGL